MKNVTRSISLVVFLMSFVLQSVFAVESEETDLVIEEIIVTAQKREQNLQDVPLSVAVVSGAMLEDRNMNEIADLSKIVPGFTYSQGGSESGSNIYVRGVGSQSFSRGVEQSVGTVIDGVVAPNIPGSLLDMGDVDRVEVLRGPQGMLFGKNASAGLLNIVTKRPTEALAFGLGGGYADLNEIKINGYISGPIFGEKWLGRLSFYSNERDALLENDFPGGVDYNNRDEWGVRGKLEYRPNDDLNVLLTVSHNERDRVCCGYVPVEVVPGSVADTWGATSGKENDRINDNDGSRTAIEQDSYIAELNYSIGESTLTSITSYASVDYTSAVRQDNITITLIPVSYGPSTTDQFTQEFRFTSPAGQQFEYVAGLYYFDKSGDRDFLRVLDLFALGFAPIPGVALLSLTNQFTVDNSSYAAFGQGTWHFNDKFRVSVGARFNREEIEIDQTVGYLPGTIPEAPPGTLQASETDNAWSWRLIGEYDISDDAMIYASAARGYKGPAANTLPSGPSSPNPIVRPEIPTSFELGLKSEWLDNRVRVNATLFHTSFDDFQASLTDSSIPPIFFLDNAGELETQGLELEVTSQITERLGLSGSLALIDATFAEYAGAPCYPGQTEAQGCVGGVQDLSGKDMANSPDVSYTIQAVYDIPLNTMPFDLSLQGSYFWQDDVQYSTNNDPQTIGDSYGVADFALGVYSKDGRFSGQLYVKNAFDTFFVSGLVNFGLLGIPQGQYLDYTYTRRVGVAFQMHF